MAQQLKHELETVVWPTGSGDLVFGGRGVHVFAGTPNEDQIPPGFPWCLVGIDNGEADVDSPEFITQGYTLLIAAEVAGDPLGEFSIIGGSVADLGKSVGRGVGEVAERVRFAVGNLIGIDGAQIMVSATSTGSPTPLGRGRHLVLDEMSLTALCTSSLHYTAPQSLAVVSGTWTWLGPHCSDRFDFLQYRLVSKTGIVPSTDPTDGTVEYTGTAATVDVVAASGKTFTIFADYNARGGSSVDGSSDPEVGSYVVVA